MATEIQTLMYSLKCSNPSIFSHFSANGVFTQKNEGGCLNIINDDESVFYNNMVRLVQ